MVYTFINSNSNIKILIKNKLEKKQFELIVLKNDNVIFKLGFDVFRLFI